MQTAPKERLGPVTGIAFVVLTFVGLSLASENQPDVDAPAATIHRYFDTNHGKILLGLTVTWIGLVAALFFFSWLAARLRASDPDGWLPGAAFAGGITFVGAMLAMTALPYAAANRFRWEETLDPVVAQTIHVLAWDAVTIAWYPFAALIGATALCSLKTRWLPKWMAWPGVVIAIGLLFPDFAWFLFIIAIVWLLVMCVLALLGKTGVSTPTIAAGPPGT